MVVDSLVKILLHLKMYNLMYNCNCMYILFVTYILYNLRNELSNAYNLRTAWSACRHVQCTPTAYTY